MTSKNTTLDDLANVIGFSATVKLAAWFGGLGNMYVPEVVEEGQLLVKLIGWPAAVRLTTEWGKEHIAVPPLHECEDALNRRLIGRMLENGFSAREIARHQRMSPRRIEQIRRELERAGLIDPLSSVKSVSEKPRVKISGKNAQGKPSAKTPGKNAAGKGGFVFPRARTETEG